MKGKNYETILSVDISPAEAFKHINNVKAWWTPDLHGSSQKAGDEFTVRFGDIHTSTQRLTKVIKDSKVEWLVTESKLNFITQKDEWNGTEISFELTRKNDATEVHFIHKGLVPEVECYESCSRGWDYYIKGSLFKLLTAGQGTPG